MEKLPPFPSARRAIARRVALQLGAVAVLMAVVVVALVLTGTVGWLAAIGIWALSVPVLVVAVAPITAFRTDVPDLGPMYAPGYDPEEPWRSRPDQTSARPPDPTP